MSSHSYRTYAVVLSATAILSHLSYELVLCLLLFFFNDAATTEIYTLSLHDALRSGEPALRYSGARRTWRAGLGSASALLQCLRREWRIPGRFLRRLVSA